MYSEHWRTIHPFGQLTLDNRSSAPEYATMTITALVVTFNRRALLERCLSALVSQSRPPDRLLIVDNASIDGTPAWLQSVFAPQVPYAECVCLDQNRGGAGGFSEGMQTARDRGADWVWMMDDDAEPHPDALHHLMAVADDSDTLYGSLAVCGDDTSWATTLIDDKNKVVNRVTDVPPVARVNFLPFLGFLIHRNLVDRIGLPDTDFFIAGDDVEYCQRAKRSGADIILVGESRIEHPKSERYEVRLPGRSLTCLSLPPWKRYYDTRNRILIAHEHYGLRLLVTQTVPGSFIRLLGSLRYDARKTAQLWAFCAGFIDGILKRKGMRHRQWHIR